MHQEIGSGSKSIMASPIILKELEQGKSDIQMKRTERPLITLFEQRVLHGQKRKGCSKTLDVQ
jgi:hypothetical protein